MRPNPGQMQTRKLDRLDAASLVELVAVLIRHRRQDHAGTLAELSADERLVTPDGAVLQIDDRLEGHREVDREGVSAAVSRRLQFRTSYLPFWTSGGRYCGRV